MQNSEFNLVNKVIMYGFNYEHNFIAKVWGETPIAKHLQSKFTDAYDRFGSGSAMFVFYTNLDNGNRKKLIEHISNNYKG